VENEKSLAVFIVRRESRELVKFMNDYTKLFRELNKDRHLAIAVLDRFNLNSKQVSDGGADIEMVAFYKRNGEWDKQFYVGLRQVKEVADRMVDWLEKKTE
jgi:hypothetical protein